MKKTILIMLSLLLVFVLAACNSEGATTTESRENTVPSVTVPFADATWGAYYQVGSDGNPAILSGDPMVIEVYYLEPTGENEELKVYNYSFMNNDSLADKVDRYIEYQGNRYYFCASSESGDTYRYTVDGDNVTVTIGEINWLTLKRRSDTEYEVISCEKGVESDLPVGIVFSVQPSSN